MKLKEKRTNEIKSLIKQERKSPISYRLNSYRSNEFFKKENKTKLDDYFYLKKFNKDKEKYKDKIIKFCDDLNNLNNDYKYLNTGNINLIISFIIIYI